MKVTLTKVYTNVKETKYGEKLSVGLKIAEKQVNDIDGNSIDVNDRYINAWFPKDTEFAYSEGDTIDIRVKQRGEYLDFQLVDGLPKPGAALEARVAKLEKQMAELTGGEVVDEDKQEDPDDF
tara:strand:+ start:2259 stop:2627 length:369 start_codon:yes stop_codon:yes gene_type:complete